jgi:predicted permease
MGLWSRLKRTFRASDQHAEEIEEELQFHLDLETARGRDPREARMHFGNRMALKEETRAAGLVEWLDSILQDARYGIRQLRKTPALVTAVVLSLTIGVGANTAIFSLIDAALLRPLPVRDPDALRIMEWIGKGFPEAATGIAGDFNRLDGGKLQGSSIGANMYRRLAKESTFFEPLIGMGDANGAAVAVGSEPAEQVAVQPVSSNFFQALGVNPALGRPFREDEDRVGQEPVVVISHRYWKKHFAGRPEDALGHSIRVNAKPVRIVGVAPAGFFGVRAGLWVDVYTPLAARVALFGGPVHDEGGSPRGEDDGEWWVRLMGRLKHGVPESTAHSQIGSMFRNLAAPVGKKFDPSRIPEITILPGNRGFNALSERDAGALWILMLLVAVLLLIVCANVANLMLSRSVGRQRESAVRLALGAPRVRLFRQYLIESVLLALLGGAAGLVLGNLLAESIHLIFQTGRDASNLFALQLDWRVLGYTVALTVLTSLLFGLAPALRASGADLNRVLRIQARSVLGGGLRLPRVLVTLQIALCLSALVAAGLLGRTLNNLKVLNVGFDRENLVYATVNAGQAGYTPERAGQFNTRLLDELRRLPGVTNVSRLSVRPLSGGTSMSPTFIPGRKVAMVAGMMDLSAASYRNSVGEHFFEIMRMPLVAGRAFTASDMLPKPQVAVVDERFVQEYFPNMNPLGQRFGLNVKEPSRYEVVGVVRNSMYNSLRNNPRPIVYEPIVPGEGRGPAHFVIRTAIDADHLASAVRAVVASIDSSVPLTEFHTQTGLIDRMLRVERLLGLLSTAFGFVALVLAAIGLAGLLAYAVARRTNEIGIRMALGADRANVIRMILKDSLWMVGAGVLLGLPGAYAIGTTLKTALFRMEPLDPAIVALSFVTLTVIALLAAWIPARRASSIDPVRALQEE